MSKTNTPTKVLYIITKSNYGGAQRYVCDLATTFSGDPAYAVAVAFGGTGARGATTGDLETRLTEAGIRTIRITHFMRDVSVSEDVRAFFELVRLIRAERPDVIHVTSSKAGALGALAGRITRVPRIIFTSHGLVFDESWRPAWQRALLYVGTWCTMMLAHATIQISIATHARAQHMPFLKSRVHLVYNGIPTPAFTSKATARSTLIQDRVPDGVWIGTIAELHPNKNLTMLVDAVALLVREGLDVHAWLIGDGEERTALEVRVRTLGLEHRVHCTGYIPDASRLLPAFDIFALPSAKEGLPYVLLEAGHASLPVVASNISGNNDIVEHEKSGLLVPNDVERLADALGTLVRNQTTREQYGTALKLRVTKLFSLTQMHDATSALYTSSNPTSSRSRSSR